MEGRRATPTTQRICYLLRAVNLASPHLHDFHGESQQGAVRTDTGFSPYIAADTLDSHILRLQQFYDTMRGGIGWGMECWIEVMPFKRRPNLAIKFAVAYEMLTVRGSTASNIIGITTQGFITTENAGSGVDSQLAAFSLGILYNPNIW